ncbi:MAG: type IV pilus modification PilV family protein [Deltaproteobacteria bacterium]
MKKYNQNGFTLLEIIIAVTLMIILSEPITNMIMQIVNTNAKAQKVKDATLLAQQYSELIQNEGAAAVPGGVLNNVLFNGSYYDITCTGGGGGGGAAVPTTITTPYLIIDGRTTSGLITINSDNGSSFGSYAYANYSIIINPSDIIISENYTNLDHTKEVQSDFTNPITISESLTTFGNRIKIECGDSSPTHINLYNFSGNTIEVYYDSGQINPATSEQLKIKYDTTASQITLHDIKTVAAVAEVNVTYSLEIKEHGGTSTLIKRNVTTLK